MQFQGGVFAGITFRCPPQKKINVAREGCASPHMNCSIIFVLTNMSLGWQLEQDVMQGWSPWTFQWPQFQKSCVQAVCFMGTWVFRQGQQKSHSILLCEKSATELSCPRQHVSSSSSFIYLLNIKILKIQYVGCKARRPQETTRLITEATLTSKY